MEKITKHIEITVNLGNFQNIKIGTFYESEIVEGESVQTANERVFNFLQTMLVDDIHQIFSEDDDRRSEALEMIGVFVDMEPEAELENDLDDPF